MEKQKKSKGNGELAGNRIKKGQKLMPTEATLLKKEKFRESVADILGLPKEDPVVELIANLGTSKDKRDRLKVADLLVKRIAPKPEEDKPIISDPLVSKIIDYHVKCIMSAEPEFMKLYYGDDYDPKKHGGGLMLVDKFIADEKSNDPDGEDEQ